MAAPQRKGTYFPELTGEERERADKWLDDYLRIVIRIYRRYQTLVPRGEVDVQRSTGRISTPSTGQPMK